MLLFFFIFFFNTSKDFVLEIILFYPYIRGEKNEFLKKKLPSKRGLCKISILFKNMILSLTLYDLWFFNFFEHLRESTILKLIKQSYLSHIGRLFLSATGIRKMDIRRASQIRRNSIYLGNTSHRYIYIYFMDVWDELGTPNCKL